MKIGAYIDGFNLYYGMKSQFSDQPAGWRWLDLRSLVNRYAGWGEAQVDRVVYCTARVNDPTHQNDIQNQDFYLRALKQQGSVDVIEEGFYVSRAKEAVMTSEREGTTSPKSLVDLDGSFTWDERLPIRRSSDQILLAKVRRREEKGSDVNVATHLLTDLFTKRIDAAIVITNDSDLALPISTARKHIPVGLINPQSGRLAGALKGDPLEGVGRHWWRRLKTEDVERSQLPQVVGKIRKPNGW